jgi:hypothetical protein
MKSSFSSLHRWVRIALQAEIERLKTLIGTVDATIMYLVGEINMDKAPHSPGVRAILDRWRQHLRYLYEPTLEVLRSLGNGTNEQPDFHATFAAIDPALPAFLQKIINLYVDRLEAEQASSGSS